MSSFTEFIVNKSHGAAGELAYAEIAINNKRFSS